MAKIWHQSWFKYFALALLASLLAAQSHAELKTHQIKAAYLYQISKFVFWPEQSKQASSFNVCQLGVDRYQGSLQKMAGRTVFQKPVVIKMVADLNQAKTCHLLILSSPKAVDKSTLQAWLQKHNILTVVDGSENWDIGMVSFALEEQRVRLHINLNLAKQSGLSFAANLLEVASVIHRDGP